MAVMVVAEDWEGLLCVCVRAWLGMTAVGAAAALEAISPVDGEVFELLILVVGVFLLCSLVVCGGYEEWEDMKWSGEEGRERGGGAQSTTCEHNKRSVNSD